MEELDNKSEEVIMLGSVKQSTEDSLDKNDVEAEKETTVTDDTTVEEDTTEVVETNEKTEGDDEKCLEDNSSYVVLEELSALADKIEQMNQLFIQKIVHTTHEEKIVDQMHAELQKYKDDLYAQLVRPILLDIIAIRDSIIRMTVAFAAKPEGEQDVPLKTFSDYSYDVQDILEKNNITIYDSKEGDDFSPIKQRAIKKVTTSVEALHGKIAESLSSGYEYMGKPISPEKVVVYVYQKPEVEEGEKE